MSGQTSIVVSGQHNGDAACKKTAPPPDVGHMIRAWRHRTGLTQEHLARALGVTFSTVSRWENGHVRPSSLAWKGLVQIAAERGSPLVQEPDSALPAGV
jgi:putative transcriptional regulator